MSYSKLLRNRVVVSRKPTGDGAKNRMNENTAPRRVVPYGDDDETPCRYTATGGQATINIGGEDRRIDYTFDLPADADVRADDWLTLGTGQIVRVLMCGPVAGGHHKIASATTALNR